MPSLIADRESALEVVEGEKRVVLTPRVLVVLDAVAEGRRHCATAAAACAAWFKSSSARPLPMRARLSAVEPPLAVADGDRRVELRDRGGEQLAAGLRRAVAERAVVVHFARRDAVAIRLGDQDVRERGQRLNFGALRIGRIELAEPARDEVGRGARALNVLEGLQRRRVDRLGRRGGRLRCAY